ncbi:MAG TPA: hypothetical protein PLU11_12205 [Chitinophagaceae bacterium]|nr:hypothetical protein [Chitinophagaceae bacterium]HPN59936.1 hypothetical protein [Chitinophagaceae bacterium]
MFIVIVFFFGSVGLYALADLISVINNNERAGGAFFFRSFEFSVVILLPLLFLSLFDIGEKNDCCSDSAFFSPAHRLSVYVLILLCSAAYYYSSLRKRTAPPLIELAVNALLSVALILCVLIAMQARETLMWIGGIPAIMFFYIGQMIINHRMLLVETEDQLTPVQEPYSKAILLILKSNVFIKFPLLLVISVPLLLFLSLVLYVFGQRPDSAIRAFTETYKHGFSQWDYQCENVECGGHYLCSVAANGHPSVVKPVRIGKRHGHYIICNRQLLVSNAFEELIQEKWPALHRIIRKQYDKVGDMVHRNYNVYSKKWVADMVYVIMKPAEWAFLLVLYLADRKPEQRIARQYAPWD